MNKLHRKSYKKFIRDFKNEFHINDLTHKWVKFADIDHNTVIMYVTECRVRRCNNKKKYGRSNANYFSKTVYTKNNGEVNIECCFELIGKKCITETYNDIIYEPVWHSAKYIGTNGINKIKVIDAKDKLFDNISILCMGINDHIKYDIRNYLKDLK